MESVVCELEGSLLKIQDPFSYFMLVAFEASGLIRFALLLTFWPLIRILEVFGMSNTSLNLTIFIAFFGLKQSEIESVARAVLPKFYMEDIDMETWGVFSSFEKKVVVTKMPRVMVESFVKEHLRADGVLGSELVVNRFGFATGFVVPDDTRSMSDRVVALFGDEEPHVYLCARNNFTHQSTITKNNKTPESFRPPRPVIFHDGRLVKRPTPSTALIIILWTPLGITLAIIRITLLIILPMWATLYISSFFGAKVIVKGNPPPPPSATNSGVLFVCSHRTLLDPVVLSAVLRRRIPAVTYSISRLIEIISPIPTIRLTRIRHVDAKNIENELAKGDLVVCPEGTTCREPFLLRFSALFAELTDRIVPVAMNYKVGFFHPTTVRGWKALDPVFLFMNPRPVYEVTFLNRLLVEATCSSGKSPHDVANHVQKILAATLGFQCTNFTRKDKYELLVGNDGTVSYTSFFDRMKSVVRAP